jgi:hypothetical protein
MEQDKYLDLSIYMILFLVLNKHVFIDTKSNDNICIV